MRDFFISHATSDRPWAEWIAVTLEQEGYTTFHQSADIRPGSDFLERMGTFAESCERMILVLSPAYLESEYGQVEWQSKFDSDRLGRRRLILPVMVETCEPPTFLKTRVYVDLREVDEVGARAKLLAAADLNRPRPTSAPFPRKGAGSGKAAFPGTGFLNHEKARTELRDLLAGGNPGVVIVQGRPGVGKSALVDTVLSDLAGGVDVNGQIPVHRHPLAPGTRLTVRTLIDDVEGSVEISKRRRVSRLSVGSLEVAVEALRNSPVVIVVDSAEQLMEAGSGQMIDLDLDEALEMLSTTSGHKVTVVLITQTSPSSRINSIWPARAHPVRVGGLPPDYFAEYLRRLEGGGSGQAFSDDEVARLHGLLGGNPRLAEIATAIVMGLDSEVTAEALVDGLTRLSVKDVPRVLVQRMCQGLHPEARRLLRALAAFGTPVDKDAISELVEPDVSAAKIEAWLQKLHRRSIIREAPDRRYYLPPSDVEVVLRGVPGGSAGRDDLLSRAAYTLSCRRTPVAAIHSLADMDIHFAELRIRLDAHTYRSALELIDQMDDILRPWNCGGLLAHAREALQNRLGDDLLETANYNALGDIYVSRGMFDLAAGAYDKALRFGSGSEEYGTRRKVYANMATMLFEQNLTDEAETKYALVLDLAREHGDVKDEMAALEGLADCHRRRGTYDQAIALARKALSAAHATGSDRAVDIGLKLARWYHEIGRIGDASRLLDAATQEAAGHGEEALSACCLEGRAGFLLDRGQIDAARQAAEQAIELALKHHDPVTLRQARTTLCLAHLKTGNQTEACREIEAALRYRRKGKSLEVLVLCGLVALEKGDIGRARGFFDDLCDEAKERRTHDGRDFAASEFYSIGICGLSVVNDDPVDEAVRVLQTARDPGVPPAPGHVNRLLFLIEYLQRFIPDRQRFLPVIDALSGTLSHQEAA